MLRYVIFIFSYALLAQIALAQENSSSSPPPIPAPVATPPGIKDPAVATRAWLDTIPVAERVKSDAYFEGGYWLILWNFLMSVGIALFLLTTRMSARLRDWTTAITQFKPLQAALYGAAFAIVAWSLSLPLACYESFAREHHYGMSNQSLGQWFGDQLKNLSLSLIVLSLGLSVLYSIFSVTGRRWWIWGTVVAIVMITLLNIAAPVFVEPLFNKYTPLADPKIRDPILALARANEIPVNQVFVVDQSRQTKRVSANVSGLGGTTRIALNDNLLAQCTLPEIREVMAHEMGHYVLNHGAKITVALAIFSFLGFALSAVIFDVVLRKRGEKWGVKDIADPAGFPLLVLLFTTYAFLLTPLSNTLTRTIEREADAFGINASREPDGMARVALKLAKYRKMEPTALEEAIFFDHPSGRARIRMAMDWKYANTSGDQGR